jgi:hypothetical protein
MRSSSAFLLLPLLSACGHPDAPKSLNALCGYLYEHEPDEETAEMEAGIANLYDWLHKGENLDSTFEGYTLENALSQDAVDLLSGNAHTVEGAVGAAVGTSDDVWSQDEVVSAIILGDPNEISPGMYANYHRDYVEDPSCFVDRDCERLAVNNRMTTTYPLGVEITTRTHGQYRWVDWDDAQVMVQRTWMDAGADVNVDWLTVTDQYYLNIVFPEKKGTLRLQATWMVASLLDDAVPEDLAISLVINSMQTVYEDIESYLEEQ